MSVNIGYLLERIPAKAVRRTALKGNRPYLGVKLIHSPNMTYTDEYLYVGKASLLSSEALTKHIGLILQNDLPPGSISESIVDRLSSGQLIADYIELADDVNLLELYEELQELWYHNEISTSVSALTTLINNGNIDNINLNDIIRSASNILCNPIFIFNKNNELLAYCCDNKVDEENIQYVLEHGHISSEHVKISRLDGTFRIIRQSRVPVMVNSFWQKNRKMIIGIIRSNNKEEGTILVLEYNRKLTASDIDIANSICNILVKAIKNPRYHRANLTDLAYAHHLSALLTRENADKSWISNWLGYLHWSEYQHFYLFAILSPFGIYDNSEISDLRAQLQEITQSSYIFIHDHTLLLIFNARNKIALTECVNKLTEILSRCNLKAGVSDRFDNIQLISEYYQQALDAVKISELFGDTAVVSSFGKWMSFDMLMKAASPTRHYDDDRLHALTEYDQRFGTDYYQTLYIFFQNAHNKTQTAKRMFIHRNTLLHRLSKIEEIIDLDFDDGEECLKLYLAFKSKELNSMKAKHSNTTPD